ncbi:MAG: AtpZ/AtpI family protein [Salinibacter sp.]
MTAADNSGHSGPHEAPSLSDSTEGGQASSAGHQSDESRSSWGRALRDVAPYLDLGWRLAATTAGPPGLGLIVDLWLQTTPWFLLGGCVVGLTGAGLLLKRLQGEPPS